jgi:hypothetical protein
MAAWTAAAVPAPGQATAVDMRLQEAYGVWDAALAVIDTERRTQMAAPACKNRRRRPSRPWTGNGTGWPRTATTR